MRFLVDAQLPRRLAHRLRDRGHDALHTLDTGAFERLLFASLADIVTTFATASFVELTRTSLVVHGR
jgi:predicted nuclease of predicted toxin-antitoxin system